MAHKVLALNTDGKLTFCTAAPEMRGKGRCNHVTHQEEGQTASEFVASIESKITESDGFEESVRDLTKLDPTLLDPRSTSKRLGLRTEIDEDVQDQKVFIKNMIQKFGHVRKPKWDQILSKVDQHWPMDIGTPTDPENYHRANLVGSRTVHHENFNGDTDEIIATYEFEGKTYELSWGEMPSVQDDGIIRINGTDWRFLPMVENRKAGLAAWGNGVEVQQEDGNLAFSFKYNDFDEDPETGKRTYWVKSYGQQIPLDKLQDYIAGRWDGEDNGDGYKLKPGPKFGLKNIDPAFLQRFPDFVDDTSVIMGLKADEPNDIEWRRVVRYEDAVQEIMDKQARRVAGTFRQNFTRRLKVADQGLTDEELDEKYPLFYQQNMTENVAKGIAGRSNVHFAESLNAFAALSQTQKISLTGAGGFSKDEPPKELRYPHKSHQGIIDNFDAAAGGNIGLTMTLANGYIGDDRLIHKNPENTEHASLKDFVPFMNHNNPARSVLSEAHLKQSVPIVGGEDPLIDTPYWKEMKGAKLGTNLRIAYIPSIGTFEDAVVISESAAKKMGTYKTRAFRPDPAQREQFQVGQEVHRKDKVGMGNINYDGVIESVSENEIVVKQFYPMTVGDKISGFSGNKGTVSRVVPDNQMPMMKNPQGLNEPVQIAMSPTTVSGRRNMGQVLETNQNFDGVPNADSKRDVLMPDGHKVQVTGGVQYIHRLDHIANAKLSGSAAEKGVTREFKNSRIGEMERILLSHSEDRLKVLNYLNNQEGSDARHKLKHLLNAIGSDVSGENFNL